MLLSVMRTTKYAAPKRGPMSTWDNSCPRLDSNSDPWTCLANFSWERSSAKNIATADTDLYKTCIKAWVSPAPGECTVPDPSSRSGGSYCSLVPDQDCSNITACPGPLGSWDDTGTHQGLQKPGFCPSVVHDVLCIHFVERCSADLECPGRLKCCDAKCERHCMQPQEGVHKLGLCPLASDKVVCTRLEEGCSSDLGCPGELKCCLVSCGRACVQPDLDSTKRSVPFQ
ncbi:uncharacterized protein LOC116944797 isoform X2 [Petromyzon marinus]|uniref:Whey acidic protein-like isoform X2 n=1 Tax=Petromyzon marinus TaxID=7757 RepID=A0AAJ7WY28_PETMA|nr:whey acidic protein-like isoform X2 [Petromyzon marinus]